MGTSVSVGGQSSLGLVKDDIERRLLSGIRQVLNPSIVYGHQNMKTDLWHWQGLTSSTSHELAASCSFDLGQSNNTVSLHKTKPIPIKKLPVSSGNALVVCYRHVWDQVAG